MQAAVAADMSVPQVPTDSGVPVVPVVVVPELFLLQIQLL